MVFFVLMRYKSTKCQIAFRDKNGRSACIWVLDVAGGGTPTRADHLFLPQNAFFFNNMVELIKTNIWSYHLLKSVNKRKNGELNRFFASLLCPESPHPIFFFNFFFFFLFISYFFLRFWTYFKPKKNIEKYSIYNIFYSKF